MVLWWKYCYTRTPVFAESVPSVSKTDYNPRKALCIQLRLLKHSETDSCNQLGGRFGGKKPFQKSKPTLSPHEQIKCQECLIFQWNQDSSLSLFTSCSKDDNCCSTLPHTLNNPIEELGTEIFFEHLLQENTHDGIKHQLCPREANQAEPNTPYYPRIPVSLINWMSFPELLSPLHPPHFLRMSIGSLPFFPGYKVHNLFMILTM